MEGELSVNDRCLDMFFYAIKLAYENNIEGADKILHDVEAEYKLSYISMNYAMQELLCKHSSFSKSCLEQGLI